MTETTKPTDRLAPQERLDQIRLFQARHTITVQRLLNRIKGSKDPHVINASRDELDRANQMADALLEERNQLEVILRDQRRERQELDSAQHSIRQIVCALISNPEYVETSFEDLVNDARHIEGLIQAL